MGVHCMPTVTAITAQPTDAAAMISALASETLLAQLESSLVAQPQVIKIGLIVNDEQARCISAWIERLKHRQPSIFVIFDPVMVSSTQARVRRTSETVLAKLIQQCDLITPNFNELKVLTPWLSSSNLLQLAKAFYEKYHIPIVAKGGHDDSTVCRDILITARKQILLESPRQHGVSVRGTGCCFASAVAGAIALGHNLTDAVVVAKMMINSGIASALTVGSQQTMAPREYPKNSSSLPKLFINSRQETTRFPPCALPLGLYPIVDTARWCRRLFSFGVKTIQLRCKHLSGAALVKEISAAIASAHEYGAQLFINDHWELAIELGAYGVHLGQDDILTADLNAIYASGLRLGISTHCLWEVTRALTIRPSYVACGPIFPTDSKNMPWVPQGLEGFSFWRNLISLPLVAIGGIKPQHLPELTRRGADGIAMISAIVAAEDPQEATENMLHIIGTSTTAHGDSYGI